MIGTWRLVVKYLEQSCIRYLWSGTTRLPEDVQNQQRSQEMTMIHRVLIMNIIHVLAHGDTDEIRPSDMDNKCCICWFSVLSILFVKCIHHYMFTYITQLAFHIPGSYCRSNYFDMIFTLKLIDKSYCQPSIEALTWHLDVFINTFINLRILVESYIPPHRMIAQLRTVYSKIVHNCYWYTDYTHCSWINNALVTRHETRSAYENYVWLTVTSS